MKNIHIKVKAGALAGALCAVLTALEPTVGVSSPAWASSLLTAIVGFLAAYATPAAGHVVAQDVAE